MFLHHIRTVISGLVHMLFFIWFEKELRMLECFWFVSDFNYSYLYFAVFLYGCNCYPPFFMCYVILERDCFSAQVLVACLIVKRLCKQNSVAVTKQKLAFLMFNCFTFFAGMTLCAVLFTQPNEHMFFGLISPRNYIWSES